MKQSKLRRRRVIRFAIVYFVLLVLFVALIAGPVFANKIFKGKNPLADIGPLKSLNLVQPLLPNNNTNGTSATGTGLHGGGGAATGAATGGNGGGGGNAAASSNDHFARI